MSTIGMVFGSLGLAALIIAFVLYIRQRSFLGKAQMARGVVTSLRATRDLEGPDMYAPVVEFLTPSGQKTTHQSNLYSSPSNYKIGDQVEVLYEPAKPSNAQIKSWKLSYVPTLIVCGLGVIFALIAAFMFLAPE